MELREEGLVKPAMHFFGAWVITRFLGETSSYKFAEKGRVQVLKGLSMVFSL